MSWRTVYISSVEKLSLTLNNLQVKYKGDKYYISLDEVGLIIIDDQSCIVTTRLLSVLCEKGISLIVSSQNKMPVGSLNSFSNNSRTSKINKQQFEMTNLTKQMIWKEVVQIKILNQAKTLELLEIEDVYLKQYASEIENGDLTNKEGQAARVYFKKLFGSNFVRFDDDTINYSLNYAYQVIRSKITQEIIGRGLHPPFGIFHRGEYNYFNLSDDLIEPYRPIVDYYVYCVLKDYKTDYLTVELKHELVKVLDFNVYINDKKFKIQDSFKHYINSFMDILSGKSETFINYPIHYNAE